VIKYSIVNRPTIDDDLQTFQVIKENSDYLSLHNILPIVSIPGKDLFNPWESFHEQTTQLSVLLCENIKSEEWEIF
jgi:hypothetical protein